MSKVLWLAKIAPWAHVSCLVLRYALEIDEQGPRWVETPEWEGLDLETRSKQGTAPIVCFSRNLMLHYLVTWLVCQLYLAGCTTQESAYEDRQTGGYCTKVSRFGGISVSDLCRLYAGFDQF